MSVGVPAISNRHKNIYTVFTYRLIYKSSKYLCTSCYLTVTQNLSHIVVRSSSVHHKGKISLLSQFFFQDSCFLSELRGEIDSFSQKACLLQMMKFLSVEVVAVVVQQVLSLFTYRFLMNNSEIGKKVQTYSAPKCQLVTQSPSKIF